MRRRTCSVACLVLLGLLVLLTCRRAHEFDTAPDAPATPVGPSSGGCDSLYLFTTSAVDQDEDSVAYRFDWGDGDTSDWTGSVASGESAGAEHAWYYARACSVKAQAKDVHGALSDWSAAYNMELRPGPRFADTVVARVAVGSEPTGIAALPSGEYVYIACASSDEVWVIRTSDNTVVATVPVGPMPMGVAASPDGQYVYVSNHGADGSMSVIRTSDNQVVDTVAVGWGPGELIVSPDGRYVYLTGAENGELSVVRTSDDTLLAVVHVGETPAGVAVTPAGDHVIVALYDESVLRLVETENYTVADEVNVGDGPWALAVAGARAYVTVENDDETELGGMCMVALPDFSVTDSLARFAPEDLPSALSLSPGNAFAYVLFWESEITWMAVVDTRRMQTLGYVGDPEVDCLGSTGVACLPDGRVYVANEYDDCVSVFGFSSGTARNSHFRPFRGER